MPPDTAVPTDLLNELPIIHRRDPSLLDLRFRPLAGGRNNRVYAWDSPDGEVCSTTAAKADVESVVRTLALEYGSRISARGVGHAR